MKFASKSTRGFYDSEFHDGKHIPLDAVEISDELHLQLLDGQSSGKVIDWSGDMPKLADHPPLSSEDMATNVRAMRDSLLTACDWTQVADAPVDQVVWRSYRQALRDVPEQTGFPLDVDWPVAPQ